MHGASPCLGTCGGALACVIAMETARAGKPLVYAIGGLSPPLGIAFTRRRRRRNDAGRRPLLSFPQHIWPPGPNSRRPRKRRRTGALTFWILLQAIWTGLTIIVLGATCSAFMSRSNPDLRRRTASYASKVAPKRSLAAPCYLIFAPVRFGSAICSASPLVYGSWRHARHRATAGKARPDLARWVAAGLMTAGLLAKTALLSTSAAAGAR